MHCLFLKQRGLIFATFVVGVLLLAPSMARADGCYLCEGGGYVQFVGSDTFELRKKAQAAGCKVSGTSGSCSNPKATVVDPRELDSRRGGKRD